MAFIISNFQTIEPAYLRAQGKTLEWLVDAHTQAESTRAALEGRHFDAARSRAHMQAAFARFGCGDDKIATRGYELGDCEHTRFREMEVYRLHESPQGGGALARTRAFERIADSVFERLHDVTLEAPSDLLHVTCTGYAAPSPAQAFVARRGWGASTRTSITWVATPPFRHFASLATRCRAFHPSGARRRAAAWCTPKCARCTSTPRFTPLNSW